MDVVSILNLLRSYDRHVWPDGCVRSSKFPFYVAGHCGLCVDSFFCHVQPQCFPQIQAADFKLIYSKTWGVGKI